MTIRLATESDRDALVRLYLDVLTENEKVGFEMRAAEEHAAQMVDSLFLPAAERSEPVLIGWTQDHQIITPECAIFIVVPGRGRGSAVEYGCTGSPAEQTQLRRVAIELLREKGIKRLLRTVPAKHKETGPKKQRATLLAKVMALEIAKIPKL